MKTNKRKYPLYKEPAKGTMLWWVGFWATVWWAALGIYILMIFWLGARHLIDGSKNGESINWIVDGKLQFGENFIILFGSLLTVTLLIIGVFWIIALKNNKITIKNGLKDLFCTLR